MTCFENPKVRSLAELVKWNEENAEKAMPERMLVRGYVGSLSIH